MYTNQNTERPSRIDMIQLLAVFGLIFISIAFVYSATTANDAVIPVAWYKQSCFRQIIWFGIGLCAAGAVCMVDYHALTRWSLVVYGVTILSLIAVIIPHVGSIRYGARRWIDLGGFQFQPSEFGKLACILALAHFLSRPMDELRQPGNFWKAIGLIVLPFLLIMKEPDLGSRAGAVANGPGHDVCRGNLQTAPGTIAGHRGNHGRSGDG